VRIVGTLKTYIVTLHVSVKEVSYSYRVKAEDDIRAYDEARDRFREGDEVSFDPDAPEVDITEYEVREIK